MLVRNWMNRPAITINGNESIKDAMSLMKKHHIRMLPVLKNDKLKGVVTDRDLKRASASDATTLDIHELLYLISKIKVSDLMSPHPITVTFDFTIEETAKVLLAHKISGVPVMAGSNEIVGIITQTDLFKALVSLAGVEKKGIQFGMIVEDRPGSIMEVANLIRSAGGRLVSVLSSYNDVEEGKRRLYIRMIGLDRKRLKELEQQVQYAATIAYIVDHRENSRKLFL